MFEIYEKKIFDFNKFKLGKTQTIDEDKVKEIIKNALKKIPNSCWVFYNQDKLKKDKSTFFFDLIKSQDSFNKYSKYFLDLSLFIKELESKAKDVWVVKISCDAVDDVMTATIAFKTK